MANGLRGVYNILATPFTPTFEVDVRSIKTLVDGVLDAGVDGVTALGVAGEAHKLTGEERSIVVASVVEAVAGRVPVVVGASGDDTDAAVRAATVARSLGATGVMVAPPRGSSAGSALITHYRTIAARAGLPVVLQDFPAVNGVHLTPAEMAELVRAVPQITTIKLESLPTPARVAKTRSLLPTGPTIVGGMGGMYLLDELRHGAAGTMTGFAYAEALIAINRAWASGEHRAAKAVYDKYLRLLVFEGQPGVGLAIRKEVLRRRGFIAHGAVRPPGDQLDDLTSADLTDVLEDLGDMPALVLAHGK